MVLYYFILASLIFVYLCIVLKALGDANGKLKTVQAQLREVTDDRNTLRSSIKLGRVPSGMNIRVGGKVVPIYNPIAIIECDSLMTLLEYEHLDKDGEVTATKRLDFAVNTTPGDTLYLNFQSAIQVSP